MARTSGVAVVNNFVRGLVTEATALSFPENACTEVNNVVFDPTGRITRRLGFDLESNAVEDAITLAPGDAYTTFVWHAVAGSGDISFFVEQNGNELNFYNISESTDISANKHTTSFNITTFLAAESDENPAIFENAYAAGNGDLFVVNAACDPFYITYDAAGDTLTATEIVIEARDFIGLDDGMELNERPTHSFATLQTDEPNHAYNLANQGWAANDAITQWDAARTDMPSNADYIALSRLDADDSFDNAILTSHATEAANRPAPKGHFILDVARDNRQEVLDDTTFTAITESPSFSLIPAGTGSTIGDFTTNVANAFDSNTSQNENNVARVNNVANAYIGKNYSADPKTIAKVRFFPANDENGFLDDQSYPLDVTLYQKATLPANGTDGTILGTVEIAANTPGGAPVTITSDDTVTPFEYVWIYLVPNASDDPLIAELQFFTSQATFERPSSVEFYAGRVFYGGISTTEKSNNIYFSQIIESKDQYGKCYQKNDPTSEEIPDLLPDDGGVIKIPEMGSLKKLFAYQSALLVFASNGIWLVSGASGSNFKADDYVVKKISSIGITSPQSLCSIKGLPAWWGEDGIYTVQFDPNYDSFTPTSLTLTVLDRLYNDIPLFNKKFAKGAYDETEQIAYWIFSSDADLSTDVYRYDTVLCLDGKSKAWYTWEISAGPIVRSIDYVKSAMRNNDAKLKFLTHLDYNGSTANQTFSEVLNENYIDWEAEGSEVNYDSYFVTGYRLDGQTQRHFQANYVFVFLEQEENASCFMQAIYDYTTSASEGKWSTRQQIYNENRTNRAVNFRRLRVRGKGRALQLRFESEDQKPFTIIGWSLFETSNTGV